MADPFTRTRERRQADFELPGSVGSKQIALYVNTAPAPEMSAIPCDGRTSISLPSPNAFLMTERHIHKVVAALEQHHGLESGPTHMHGHA
eukprot:1426870-Pyramimonas_sp.AAC.2